MMALGADRDDAKDSDATIWTVHLADGGLVILHRC